MAALAVRDVPDRWRSGRVGSAGSLTTDGERIWSYELLIGITDESGRKIAYDYTGEHSPSVTTSKHVNYAKRAADETVAPPDGGAR